MKYMVEMIIFITIFISGNAYGNENCTEDINQRRVDIENTTLLKEAARTAVREFFECKVSDFSFMSCRDEESAAGTAMYRDGISITSYSSILYNLKQTVIEYHLCLGNQWTEDPDEENEVEVAR